MPVPKAAFDHAVAPKFSPQTAVPEKHAVICAPRDMLEALGQTFRLRGISPHTFATNGSLTLSVFESAMDKTQYCLFFVGQNPDMELLLLRTQQIRAKTAKVGFVCLSDQLLHIERLVEGLQIPFVSEPEHGISPFRLGQVTHTLVEQNPVAIVNAFLGRHV